MALFATNLNKQSSSEQMQWSDSLINDAIKSHQTQLINEVKKKRVDK